jgi:hypothetical protein
VTKKAAFSHGCLKTGTGIDSMIRMTPPYRVCPCAATKKSSAVKLFEKAPSLNTMGHDPVPCLLAQAVAKEGEVFSTSCWKGN